MNALRALACSALALSLAACNRSSNTPASLDDGGAPNTPVSPDNSGQPDTGDYVSMNRALNACPLIDDADNSVDVTNCQFTTAPISITNSPAHFSADGSTLLIHSVSRFSSITNEQVVEGFLIDVDEAAAYSLPGNFSGNPDRINAASSGPIHLHSIC